MTALAALLAAGVIACGDDGAGPEERVAAALQVASGGLQQDTIEAALSPVSIRAVDEAGDPVPDVAVSFRVTRGGGSIDPATTVTDPSGIATATWTLGPESGLQRLEARTPDAGPVTVEANALPGKTAQIIVEVDRVTMPADEEVRFQASLVDRNGNAIIDRSPEWRSPNEAVATAERGRIVGVAPGETTVEVSADDLVLEIPTRIVASLAERTLFLFEGGTLTVASGDGSDETGLVGGENPVWSPDGSRIALNGPGTGLPDDAVFVVDVASGAVSEPAETFMSQWSPSWSPDGDSLAFIGERPVGFGEVAQAVYKVSASGGAPQRISPEFGNLLEMGGWSPAGDRAAYHRAGDIFVVGIGGGDTIQVTPARGEGTSFLAPVWNPDGTGLALVAEGLSGAGSLEIGFIRTDNLQLEILGNGVAPSWRSQGAEIGALRPAGDEIVPVVYASESSSIRVFDRAAGDVKVGPLSWTTDGSLLLYGIQENGELTLAAVSEDGSWSRRLGGGLVASDPFWAWRP